MATLRTTIILRVAALAIVLTLLLRGLLPQSLVSAAPLAASAGANFAGTATGAWANLSSATGANNNVCALGGGFNLNIDLTNFSFSIPAGSTITGILVEPKDGDFGAGKVWVATLLNSGAPAGTSKNYTPGVTENCAGTAFHSLGGAGDKWGATWTASDINASNFGVRINNGPAGQPFLDAVRITIFFDSVAATPTPTPVPKDVPEADTLLLFGGGLGGLATWLGWQYRKIKIQAPRRK